MGCDQKLSHLLYGRRRGHRQLRVVARAEELPFADGAVDWALSSLLLHHFDRAANLRVLADRYFNCRPLVVGKPECLLPVPPRVDAGTQVGPDRLVNTAGAFDRHEIGCTPAFGGPTVMVSGCGGTPTSGSECENVAAAAVAVVPLPPWTAQRMVSMDPPHGWSGRGSR